MNETQQNDDEYAKGELVTTEPRAVQAANNPTPMQLIQEAVKKDMPIEKLEKLMDLAERHEKNEARRAYHQAVARFRNESISIEKTKRVNYTNRDGTVTDYKHADLGVVVEKVSPVLAKHGLSFHWTYPPRQGDEIFVNCVLTHEYGHSEEVSLSAPIDTSGKKNPIQSRQSTVSYLERYTLLGILGLAAKDDDGAGAGDPEDERITEEQVKVLRELIDETDSDEQTFVEWLGYTDIALIWAGDYQRAHLSLKNKRAAMRKKEQEASGADT